MSVSSALFLVEVYQRRGWLMAEQGGESKGKIVLVDDLLSYY